MHRITPRLAARRLACAAVAVPALFAVAGCIPESGGEEKESPSGSPSSPASLAPVKFEKLPDPCKTLSGDTVKNVVPGASDANGKNLTSSDTNSYGSCLWSGGSGENDAEYRSLTVSLKRYESDGSLGSGDKQAERFFTQEAEAVRSDGANKGTKESPVDGTGGRAVVLTYETEKKKQDYRVSRVIVLHHNVVITVDHEGTGFEGAKLPGADEIRKNAEKAAKEAAKALG